MFGLNEAVDKIKILWEKDGKAGAPKEVAIQHLGHSKLMSGPPARTLSALKQFGLTEEKDGRIIVSQIGMDIILYPHDDDRHVRSLKKAALEPNIYKKLFHEYQDGFPSRETIKAELISGFEFNHRRVDGFLNDFLKTLEYAGLQFGEEQEDKRREDGSEDHPQEDSEEREKSKRVVAQNHTNSFPILLRNQNRAMLSFERLPVSKSDIELLKKWIDLFEHNLTAQPEDFSS